MHTEVEGAQAIIDLQRSIGKEETLESALKGWRGMNEHQREQTMLAHATVCRQPANRD